MPLLEAGAPTTAMVLLQWKGTHTGFDRNRIDTQSPSKTGGNQGRLPTGLLGQGGSHRSGPGEYERKPTGFISSRDHWGWGWGLLHLTDGGERPGEAR